MKKRRNKKQTAKKLNIIKKHNEKMYDECFNLDCTIIEFLLPRLKWFKNNAIGWPDGQYGTMEEYKEEIQKIIDFFEKNDLDNILDSPEHYSESFKTFERLGRIFYSLWI